MTKLYRDASTRISGFCKKLLTILAVSISTITLAQAPSNDDPCNAILLTPASTCAYQNFTTVNATPTAGVPAPGCANYNGSDVWFKVVVPCTGVLSFDT